MRPPGPVVALGLAAALAASCRFEVRLDAPATDAGARDATLRDTPRADAPRRDAPDVGDDAPPVDAPVRPCIAGVDLMPAPATSPESRPTLVSTGSDADLRVGLLRPPPARDDGTLTALTILDAEGAVLSVHDLSLADGAGGEAVTATLHERLDAPGFVVLAPAALVLVTDAGDPTPIALAVPPLPSRQREAGWLDAAHFAYVGDTTGAPVVTVDVGSGVATPSTLTTEGAARVLFTRTHVVVSPALPDATVREHGADLVESLAIAWPTGALGERLVGASNEGSRRWLVHDGAEFRTHTELFEVTASGTTLRTETVLRGPLTTTQSGDLVVITTADPAFFVFDLRTEAFVALAGDATGLALAVRAGTGYVTVTREAGPTGPVLVYRCVP